MDHGLELIIPDPGNIWKFDFYIFSPPGNTENLIFLILTILEILEIEVFNILPNPGNIGKSIFLFFPYPGNTGNMIFLDFLDFYKKDARRNFTQDAPTDGPRSLI